MIGACPSRYLARARGRVHPGQSASPSKAWKSKGPFTLKSTPPANFESPVKLHACLVGRKLGTWIKPVQAWSKNAKWRENDPIRPTGSSNTQLTVSVNAYRY